MYNEIVKRILAIKRVRLQDLQAIFEAGGKPVSRSRAGSYFKAPTNSRYLSMSFNDFSCLLFGISQHLNIEDAFKPKTLEECIQLIRLLLPDVELSDAESLEHTMRKLNDYA